MNSKLSALFSKYQTYFLYFVITLLPLLKFVTTRKIPCPENFDCNSYIQMVGSLQYTSDIAPHHAMRILPSFIVNVLTKLGASIDHGFWLLSGGAYILFGVVLFAFFNTLNTNRWLNFAISLLILNIHPAMREHLFNVYQACDALTYLLGLMIMVCIIKNKYLHGFLLSLLGILTRQNLFILSVFSFIELTKKNKKVTHLILLSMLVIIYMMMMNYYHASGVFKSLLSPPYGYFAVGYWWEVFWVSGVYELFIPLLPFLFAEPKRYAQLLIKFWPFVLYAIITIGQPFLAFHMTGNNFLRLALQGAWVFYFFLPFVFQDKPVSRYFVVLTCLLALAFYTTWAFEQRLFFVLIFSGLWLVESKALPQFLRQQV